MKINRKVIRRRELTPDEIRLIAKQRFMHSMLLWFLPFMIAGVAVAVLITTPDTGDPWFIAAWSQFPAMIPVVSVWAFGTSLARYLEWVDASEVVTSRQNRRRPKGFRAWLRTPSALQ